MIKIIATLSVLILSFNLQSQEKDIASYNSTFEKISLLRTEAEYADFILHTYQEGHKIFESRLSKYKSGVPKVWVRQKGNIKYIVSIIPTDSKGSVLSIQSFDVEEKKWDMCRIGEMLGGYEVGPVWLESAEDVCNGEI